MGLEAAEDVPNKRIFGSPAGLPGKSNCGQPGSAGNVSNVGIVISNAK